tara:strand:+ start:2715 stop:3842 length:1128 start_codon:yes stop_codon:yes gene_type:complete
MAGEYGRGSRKGGAKAHAAVSRDSAENHRPEAADEFMTSEERVARDSAIKLINKDLVYPAKISGVSGKKKKRLRRRKAFKADHDKKVQQAINQVGRLREVASTRALGRWEKGGQSSSKSYRRKTPNTMIAARDTSNDNRRNDQLLRQTKDFSGKTTYSDAKARKALRNSRVNGATIKYSDRSTARRAARERGDAVDNWRKGEKDAVQFGEVGSGSALRTRNSIANAQRGRFGEQWGDTEETRLDSRSGFLGYGSDRDINSGGFGAVQGDQRHAAMVREPSRFPNRGARRGGEPTRREFTTQSQTGRHTRIDNAERAYMNLDGGTSRSAGGAYTMGTADYGLEMGRRKERARKAGWVSSKNSFNKAGAALGYDTRR